MYSKVTNVKHPKQLQFDDKELYDHQNKSIKPLQEII